MNETNRLLNESIEYVDVRLIKTHPKNTNQGDLGVVIESIMANGFYGTIVVNRKTMHVVSGNHRLKAAIELGYKDVPVTFINVSESEELRILAVDNRSTRLGVDDDMMLAELLSTLAIEPEGLLGTGYDGDDLDALLEKIADDKPLSLGSVSFSFPQKEADLYRRKLARIAKSRNMDKNDLFVQMINQLDNE